MNIKSKISLVPVTIIIVGVLIFSSYFWFNNPDRQPIPHFVETPAQESHIQAFLSYAQGLEKEGLNVVKAIRVEQSEPFIFLLQPKNSQEVSNEDTQFITDLAVRTVSVLESGGGLRHDDIDIVFNRPVDQKIIIIKRHDMPALLSENTYGEMTVSMDSSYFTSFVNLAGPTKSGRRDFSVSWSTIQAICLAYGAKSPDSDPICNIIAANGAAGWAGMDTSQAEAIINGYGMTQLSSLGNRDYKYRFIDFVFEAFSQ